MDWAKKPNMELEEGITTSPFWVEGVTAFALTHSTGAPALCPYKLGTQCAKDWRRGFADARAASGKPGKGGRTSTSRKMKVVVVKPFIASMRAKRAALAAEDAKRPPFKLAGRYTTASVNVPISMTNLDRLTTARNIVTDVVEAHTLQDVDLIDNLAVMGIPEQPVTLSAVLRLAPRLAAPTQQVPLRNTWRRNLGGGIPEGIEYIDVRIAGGVLTGVLARDVNMSARNGRNILTVQFWRPSAYTTPDDETVPIDF